MRILGQEISKEWRAERDLEVEVESIISFQSEEQFNEATGILYENLSDKELIEVLLGWHDPGNHDTNFYNANGVDTNFLGFQVTIGLETYLLSRYENGLTIGLSRILRIIK